MEAVAKEERRVAYPLVPIFALLAAGIVTSGYFYYRNYERHFHAEAESQLSAIAELKVDELAQYRRERLWDAGAFFQNPAFSSLVRRFLNHPEDAEALPQLQEWAAKYLMTGQYDLVCLFDAQGVIRMAVPVEPPISSFLSQNVSEILRSNRVIVQDFTRNKQDQRAYLALLVPIFDESDMNRPLGVLALQIDPETYLYPFIKRWPTPSRTGETLLVRRDGNDAMFLNDLKFGTNAALNLRVSLANTNMPAVKAILGQEGVVEGADYRAVPSLAALKSVTDSPWFLVAKMDTAEVYAPLRERLRLTILFVGLLLISAGAGMGALWRHQRSRFYKERYKMAETLRASEARYRRLFETAKDGILILDAGTGMVMDVNPFLIEKLGFPREALLGKKIWELGFFKDIVANEAKFEELQKKEYIRYEELPLKTSDGRRINVEFVSNVYLVDQHKVIQCNIRDITERRQAEEALRQAHNELEKRVTERTAEVAQERRLLRTLIDNLPDGVYAKDTAGRKIMANPADLKVLGCRTEAEAIGKSDFDLFPKDMAEQFWADDQKVIRGEPVINREEFVLDEQGRKSWLLTSKLPLRDQDGKIVGLVGIGRNITERKQAEEALRQSHDELEKRVAERTAELAGANAILQQQIAERKRIELILDRERLLLRTLVDNLPDAIYAKDTAGRKTMANPADLKNLRCQTEAEAIGKNDFDLFPKEIAEQFWADDQKVIQGEPVINREEYFLNDAGEKRWLLTSKLPLRDPTGKIVGLVGIGHDITERKRAEEALRQEQALMATLMENVPDAVYFKDAASRFIRVNHAMSRKFGLSDPAQLVGKSDADFFSGEHAQQALADEQEIIHTGRPLLNVEEKETWIDGTVSWVLTTKLPLRDAAGRVIGTCGISLDISDRKRVEQALAERTEEVSQRNQELAGANATLQQQIAVRERIEKVLEGERNLLRTLIDSLPDYVYAKDAEGRFTIANTGVARQLGFASSNEVIGKSDFDLFPRELAARYRAEEQDILRSGKGLYSHEGPTVDASKPEKNRWVSTTKVPLRNELGEITGFIGLGHDITERKRVEEALQKSSQELQDRNDELARFTYTASHDLKSPLVTVKAFLGYLEQDTSNQDAEAIKKDRQYIYTAVDKMTRLLDELLDLARVGRKMNPPEEVPLQVVVKDALDMVAGRIIQQGVEVVVTNEPVMLCGDRTRLVEVFQNLVDNAIKFMGDQPAPRVEIGVEKAGEENVFLVRDNGIGIDPRYQPKVFGLFEKYDPASKGTGIGLALVKRIVEVHGGKIWVESAGIGKGTTFRFTLAKIPPQPAQP